MILTLAKVRGDVDTRKSSIEIIFSVRLSNSTFSIYKTFKNIKQSRFFNMGHLQNEMSNFEIIKLVQSNFFKQLSSIANKKKQYL